MISAPVCRAVAVFSSAVSSALVQHAPATRHGSPSGSSVSSGCRVTTGVAVKHLDVGGEGHLRGVIQTKGPSCINKGARGTSWVTHFLSYFSIQPLTALLFYHVIPPIDKDNSSASKGSIEKSGSMLKFMFTPKPQSGVMCSESESHSVLSDSLRPQGILQARILEWVPFRFSRVTSQPRDQSQVYHIAGRFFTSWATREAQNYV